MRNILKHGDTIGVISCSDGRKTENEHFIKHLNDTLVNLGLKTIFATLSIFFLYYITISSNLSTKTRSLWKVLVFIPTIAQKECLGI